MSSASSSREKIALLVQGIVVVVALACAIDFQRSHYAQMEFKPQLYEQKLRLPDPKIIRVGTLGFRHLYADIMFLRAAQAYGGGWLKPGQSRQPIYDYFETVSEVEPHFIPLYRFGNLLVADIGGEGEMGQKLLRKGLIHNPSNWELAYLGIYNSVWQLDQPDQARWFLKIAKRIKDTPNYVLRMEEYVERRLGRYDAAFDVNVDYFVRYQRAGNEQERQLLYNRFEDILDKWARKHLLEGIDAYYKANHSHPTRMEDIISPKYLPQTLIPSMAAMEAAAEEANNSGMPLEEAVEYVRKKARLPVAGLPPEPKGTWYYIDSARLDAVLAKEVPTTASLERRYPYIASAGEFNPEIDQYCAGAFASLYEPYLREDGSGKVPQDILDRTLVADPIGGHYVVDYDKKRFFSTARQRIALRQDPRVGASGPGPFPLPLEPTLTDFAEDFDWAVEKGIYDKAGNRLKWDKPGALD